MRHGGTYKASDNFPAQTNGCQDSLTSDFIPHAEISADESQSRRDILQPN